MRHSCDADGAFFLQVVAHDTSSFFRPELIGLVGASAPTIGHTASRSFTDAHLVLRMLRRANGTFPLVYMSMIYGAEFSKYLERFVQRARAVGIESLVLFTCDDEAYISCLRHNGGLCVRCRPGNVSQELV
jgi:hypothetical protein